MPTITGTEDADTLAGTSEADVIVGLAGDDILDGGSGADSLDGGSGNDILLVDNAGDLIVERSGEGTDEVRASVSFALAAHVENLFLTGTAIEGVGNSLNNRITGNALANVFRGGGGTDTFVGGGGNDLFYVQGTATMSGDGGYAFSGVDQVVEAAGGGVDQVTANVSYTLGANVENLRLTGSLDLSGFGNELDNRILGNIASNFLRGGLGDDYLDGGAGPDHLDGGDGNDTYVVDDYYDQLGIESPADTGGIDTIISYVDRGLDFGFENLTLAGSAINGQGNTHDNRIIGNAAGNALFGDAGNDRIEGRDGGDELRGGFGADLVFGGNGDDFITGDGGSDRIYGDAGNDQIDGGFDADILYGGDGDDSYTVDHARDVPIERAGEGNDIVYASVTHTLRANIENIALTGSMSVHARGNGLSNSIIGNTAANTLRGEGGDDVLDGGSGGDWLEGGAGIDSLRGGLGSDRFVFRDGDLTGATAATADVIEDFGDAEGDRIHLGVIDANAALDGNQAFGFIGTGAFSGTAGELRYAQIDGNTFVQGDTDGDGAADFWIRLDGLHTLGTDDFVL